MIFCAYLPKIGYLTFVKKPLKLYINPTNMNFSKTLTLISKLAFFIFFLFSLNVQAQNLNQLSREQYTEFLNNHPFMKRKRMTKEEIKKLPKKDRPDLAWELDYLTTMDPATGKPERERLFPTLDIIDQMQATLTPAVPGSSPAAGWIERGPDNVGGRTRALMWDPNDATGKKVWAGGVTGGLWYNNDITNANSQWQSINDFWDNIAITCIAYDPNDPDTMYVGTGEGYGSTSTSRGAGIWKTTDGGTTWSRLSSTTNFYYVNDIVVRNENGNSVIYAAVDGNFYNGVWHGAAQAGLQRSTNDGATWSQVLPAIPNNSPNYVASDIEIGPNNRLWIGTRRTPYAATDRGGGRVLYSDNGTSWTTAYSHTVTNGYGRVEVAVAPSNASYVYAVIEDQNQVDGIVRTTNGGSTWSNLSEPNDDDLGIPATDFTRGQAWYDLIAAVDPNNPNNVIVGGINLHRSTNGGTSWSQISKWSNNPNMGTQSYSYVHADQHNILFKPGSSSEVIFGTDGGVFWSNNIASAATSNVISARNNGYNVTQFYAGAINPISGSNIMVAGSQDNGTHRYNASGINSTTEISGGDGAYCFIDQTNGLDVVTSYVYNNYYYHNNSGSNYVRKILSNSNNGLFINPADLDDANNILYTSRSNGQIYKITNYNLSTYNVDSIAISGISGLAMPTAIKVSPYNNSANVYVGDMSGNLVKINNANGSSPTFTNLTPGNFPNGAISSIEFGSSENEILVTFKNYGVISIFYSTTGGTSWAINGKEGNLPDMPVRWALMNPNNNNEVILATEVGIWATTNFQASTPTWSPSNSGLANCRVDMLQHRASDNTVMAITHGRGVFTSAWTTSSTPSTTSKVRFRVNMNNKVVSANGVHVAGNFQTGNSSLPNWNPAGITLYDSTGTGIYEVVLELTPGSYEYKFINGNTWGNGNEELISVCNAPNGTNRQATISLGDTTLPAFCFNECSVCAQNDVLYSFDFTNGLPLGWSNIGSSTASVWEYRGPTTTPSNSIGSRGAYAGANGPIQSASASNGFMVFDSDYLDDPNGASGLGAAPAPHVGSIRTQTLDFTNQPNVLLQFQSFFRTFESAVGIAISTNGGSSYPDTVYIHTNLNVNQASFNSELIRLDISSYVGGQSNVKIAFVFDGRNPLGLNGGTFQRAYYFWQIDDVKFLRTPNNDLNLTSSSYTFNNMIGNYGKYPYNVAPQISFSGDVQNEGLVTQPNTKITFSSGSQVYQTNGVSLSPGNSTTLTSSSNFIPAFASNFQFTVEAGSDSMDQFINNNYRFFNFELTDSAVTLSHGGANEVLGTNTWANSSDSFTVANILELKDSVYLNSIIVGLSGASTPGGKIKIIVWDYNQAPQGGGQKITFIQPQTSALYTLTATDISNGSVKLPILGNNATKKMAPGKYYIGAMLFGNNGADTVRVPSDLTYLQAPNAAVIYIPFSSGFPGIYTNGNAFHITANITPVTPSNLPPMPTANGDTIYKFDFNSGIPTGWANMGDTSTSLWEYRGPNTTPNINTGSRGAFFGTRLPIQSKTRTNGFMVFDSDYLDDPNGAAGAGVSPAPHVGALYTQGLNFAGRQNVTLQFDSYFRTFESGAGIAFSTDGGLTYPDTIYVHDQLLVNAQTANAETVRIDVSSFIGGQPNVKVAFIFDGRNPLGLNGGALQRAYYFWMIDDISFLTSPNTDLIPFDVVIKNPNGVGQHAAIPSFLYQNQNIEARLTNHGVKTATNTDVYCVVGNALNNFIPNFSSSSVASLNAGDTSNVLTFAPLFSNYFSPINTYYFTLYPRSDSAEGYTPNDTIYRSFQVTGNEYRLHTNNWNASIGTNFNVAFGTADSVELINEFIFPVAAQIDTMTIWLGGATRVGAVAIPKIYSGSLGSGLSVAYFGNPYTITSADTINGFAKIPVNFSLTPGNYYVGVMLNSNNTASHIALRDDLTLTQHPDASLFVINGIFYSNGNAIHITLKVSPPPTLAQIDLPITWDNASTVNYDIVDFDGTFSALVSDPVNSSNTVLKTDKSPSGQPWQGTVLGNTGLANPIPFAQGATTISALVFSPDSGIQVRLKVENSNNAQISVETEATTTKANSWETLTFDFSNHVSGTAAINFANTYDKLVIFYDFFNNPSTTKSYYVDSIYFGPSTTPILAQIDLPITWDDTTNVDYSVIDFGGNASMLAADPTNASNLVLQSDKTSGAQTWAGTVLGNASLATTIPFAQGATTITAVVYSPDSGIAVRLKAEQFGQPTISVETENLTTKANAWDTLVFDFSNHVVGTSPINFSNTYNQLAIFYDFGVSPTTTKTYYLDNVFFGGSVPNPTYNVTFKVDMKYVTQSYTTPELNGTFNNWCGNCTPMTDANNDTVWEVTIPLQAGTYEYKFAADNWAIDEILTQGSFCTVTNGGFTNRVLTVTGDTVLPAVCWASCNTCSPPPPTYNVTFQVDMNNVTQPFNTPEVNGTFNSWCGNCNAMSDSNNDGIWDVTLTLPADTFEFKYSADSWTIQEQLTPGLSCVVTNFGFTNRYLVITGDTTLPVVCWESCQACPPPCPSLGITPSVTNVNCFGDSSGAITVSAFGGNDPYTYDWGFAQGATITGLQAGWYQVTVTDSSNCVDSSWIQVFQPTLPLTAETDGPLAIFEVTNPNGSNFLMDFGAMDATTWGTNLDISSTSGQLVVAVDSTGDSLLCGSGIANASAINGNIAVAYRGGCEFGLKALRAQQAGATGLVLINNVPNNVNLGGGAFGNQVNIPVVLLNPQNGQILRNLMKQGATVYFGADTVTPIEPSCNGNTNGELAVNVFGGTSPYTYAWSNNQGGRVNSGLGSGVYAVTVTDNNGCTTVDSVTLNQPNTLSIALANATNPTSSSATNGSISVNVAGGTPPYSGFWNTNPVQTGLQANNLGVGSYTINVTDSNGCTGIFSYGLCVDDTSSSSVAICQGDSALIFGNFETNGGFYYQTYQTSSGCDSVIEVELVVNSNPVILGVTVNQVTGCGTNDGSISLQGISANSSSITYALNTGQSQVNNGVFTGLFPAIYDVTVTDSLGCSNNTGPLVINPFAGSPGQPTVSGNTSFQYCVGDPIQTITATGGAGMLYWYDNANLATPIDSGSSFTPPNVVGFNAYYVAEVASGCQGPPAQIFVEISPVPPVPVLTGAGTYCDVQSVNPVFAQGVGVIWYGDSALTVQVGSGSQLNIGVFASVGVTNAYATSNSNGCISAAANISVTVLPPVPTPTVSNVAYCDNESAIGFNANILSGNSPRWYSDAGLNNLVSVNPQFTPSTSIGTSTFYLTQFDGTCESPAVTANSTVYQSPVVNSVFTIDVSICGATDGSLSINASVNNIGPKYSIDNGVSYQPTSSFSNLAAAGYIIVVADTFCSTTYGIATIAAPGAPAAPNVSGNDTICDGDSYNGFTAMAQGSGDLTWYSSPLLGLNNQVDTGMAYTPSNLNVGVNTYYVTETQGTCEGAASSVSIIVNGLPNVSAGIDQSICDGGSATLVATGAVSYNWVSVGNNDTVVVSPTTQTTFTVIGTSAAGCIASDSMVVSINPLPTVAAGTVAPICIDAGNFILPKGSPNGGQYSGLNVSSNTFLVGQAGVGTHVIYYDYTDANGCSNTDSTFVVVNPLPSVSLGAIANICANDAPVSLSSGTPANGVYSGPGVSSGSFDPAAAGGAGTYNIIYAFTDTNGCSSSDTNAITVDTVPVISWIAFPTICELDGPYTLVEASPSGGVYSGTGVSSGVFDISTVTIPGSYEITYDFTDGNGCIGTGSQFIDAVNNPVVNLGPDTVLCNNRPSITLDAGVGATFDWILNGTSTGQTSQTITVDSASSGTYVVVVANADGCEGSDTIVVDYTSICVGVETIGNVEGRIAVYPNPTQGIFTLEVSDISALSFEVQIFNTGGQIVYDQTFANTKYVREEIDLSGLSRGIYYINLKTETGLAKYKLILN